MLRTIRIAAVILVLLGVRVVDARDLEDQIIVMFQPNVAQFQGDLLEALPD